MPIPNSFIEWLIPTEKNNGIESLMVNGTLSSDQGIIADYITHFFMNLYSE